MPTPIRTTTILDDERQPHAYQMALHGAATGFPLGSQLLELFGETLKYERGIGACIEGLAKGIQRRGDVKFMLQLLEFCSRDGERIDAVSFDQVYSGNYGELIRVLVWVIEQNFAGFSGAAVEMVGGRLEKSLSTFADKRWLLLLSAVLTGDFGALLKPGGAAGSTSATTGPSTT
jgi:hypothetical protein